MFKPCTGINCVMVGPISSGIKLMVNPDSRNKARENKVDNTQRRGYEES